MCIHPLWLALKIYARIPQMQIHGAENGRNGMGRQTLMEPQAPRGTDETAEAERRSGGVMSMGQLLAGLGQARVRLAG